MFLNLEKLCKKNAFRHFQTLSNVDLEMFVASYFYPVKKMRKSVIEMQQRFWVYVCACITRQRVRERERESLKTELYVLLTSRSGLVTKSWFKY